MFLSSKGFTGVVREGLGIPSEGGKQICQLPQCLCCLLTGWAEDDGAEYKQAAEAQGRVEERVALSS